MNPLSSLTASAVLELEKKALRILEDDGDLLEARRLIDKAIEILKAHRSKHEGA